MHDIVVSMDKELESVRDKFMLLDDIDAWSTVLSSRVRCRFDLFCNTVSYELERNHAMLLEIYDGDLLGQLEASVVSTQQRYSKLDQDLWPKFKFQYDIYLLHLENADREDMRKALPNLKRECEDDLPVRVSAMTAEYALWNQSFRLVLTEGGIEKCMEELTYRRMWITGMFPSDIQCVVQELKRLFDERRVLLQTCDQLWNDNLGDWFARTGNCLPVEEFFTELTRYADICRQLVAQSRSQQELLGQLRTSMATTDTFCTMVNHRNRQSSDGVHIKDIRESFKHYDRI
ncbi:hypothetical protein OH76DRAFT_1491098 [Lentinus brumalis]|uniref:Uncharacterized protein n=1 Tax=Lentinus brumalis TaxID=2498619 RepID=A0A371CGS8_9APHY|nr:hypothetical protein OH76DRAFT_1491098 [Polyporus brumalis]